MAGNTRCPRQPERTQPAHQQSADKKNSRKKAGCNNPGSLQWMRVTPSRPEISAISTTVSRKHDPGQGSLASDTMAGEETATAAARTNHSDHQKKPGPNTSSRDHKTSGAQTGPRRPSMIRNHPAQKKLATLKAREAPSPSGEHDHRRETPRNTPAWIPSNKTRLPMYGRPTARRADQCGIVHLG